MITHIAVPFAGNCFPLAVLVILISYILTAIYLKIVFSRFSYVGFAKVLGSLSWYFSLKLGTF